MNITNKEIDEILSEVDFEMDKKFINKLTREMRASGNEKSDLFISLLEVFTRYTHEYLYHTITKLKEHD